MSDMASDRPYVMRLTQYKKEPVYPDVRKLPRVPLPPSTRDILIFNVISVLNLDLCTSSRKQPVRRIIMCVLKPMLPYSKKKDSWFMVHGVITILKYRFTTQHFCTKVLQGIQSSVTTFEVEREVEYFSFINTYTD